MELTYEELRRAVRGISRYAGSIALYGVTGYMFCVEFPNYKKTGRWKKYTPEEHWCLYTNKWEDVLEFIATRKWVTDPEPDKQAG